MKIRPAKKIDACTLGQLALSAAPVLLAAIFDINDEFSVLNFLRSSFLFSDG
jgi:hypothetical protein